jgi:hypothetical protein
MQGWLLTARDFTSAEPALTITHSGQHSVNQRRPVASTPNRSASSVALTRERRGEFKDYNNKESSSDARSAWIGSHRIP